MILLDANLLIYAYAAGAEQQAPAAAWLDALLASDEPIGLPWVSIWAFLRICTNSRACAQPLNPEQAFAVIRGWLEQPGVFALSPGPRHAEILERQVRRNTATGPLMSDAVLAALAIENGATLASTDQDFRRFEDLKWVNPLAAD